MYAEDQLLPLSALQHLLFCERQCALIHVEGLWADNVLTVQGAILHERTGSAGGETRGPVRIARGLRLRSLSLGLAGIADVVEFHRIDPEDPGAGDERPSPDAPCAPPGTACPPGGAACPPPNTACPLPEARGLWRPFPVEYKRGRPKHNSCDAVQLCAQAICLEEALGVKIEAGALFYGTTRRRVDVALDAPLREETQAAARRLHELIDSGVTPKAEYGKWCKNCSLAAECMPKATAGGRSAKQYLETALEQIE